MLTVIVREDATTDRGQDPELGGSIEWDFTDPSLYDLERPPEGVDEWVRGDPGGGVRSTASVQVTPGFPSDGVDHIPVPATDAPCASCDFTGYHEVANSYVQWFVMKDDVQISLVSERPEVWPQMRSWLDRFAIRMDEIDTRSRPAASNTELPTGYVSVLDLDSESTAPKIDARVLADILGRGMISFDPALGQVTATIACHILTADYTTTSEQLLITDDTVEEAATCEPPAEASATDLEAAASAVFDVLRSAPQWTRTQGTRLTLTTPRATLSGTIGTP